MQFTISGLLFAWKLVNVEQNFWHCSSRTFIARKFKLLNLSFDMWSPNTKYKIPPFHAYLSVIENHFRIKPIPTRVTLTIRIYFLIFINPLLRGRNYQIEFHLFCSWQQAHTSNLVLPISTSNYNPIIRHLSRLNSAAENHMISSQKIVIKFHDWNSKTIAVQDSN